MRKFIRGVPIQRPIGFIILPMIDVIFLLLLFFVVVTSFEASANVKVEVPSPESSQAQKPESSKQVIINCEPVDHLSPGTSGAMYRVGGDPPESLSEISDRLAAAKAANPQLTVVIRADRHLPFAPVRAVMQVVADNGIEMMNLSAVRDLER